MTVTPDKPAAKWKRVRIRGILELKTPLTIGDGTTRPGEKNDAGETSQVARIARASDHKPMIPGPSLKGVLRAYLRDHGVASSLLDSLFGRRSAQKVSSQPSTDSGCGGCVEFGYSYSKLALSTSDLDRSVVQAVAIDRVTRTASDRQLFAFETVPATTRFDVELLGFQMSDEEVAALLFALEGFNDPRNPVQLGAGTSNNSGRATWTCSSVNGLQENDIRSWLSAPLPPHDYWKSSSLNVAQLPGFHQLPGFQASQRVRLRFAISLHFESWFLVRDPHKKKAGDDQSDDEQSNHETTSHKERDAFPRCTSDGHVLAPARSFRGALRSQAERIARTLNDNAGGDPVRDTLPGLVETLFGYSGGRTVVDCSEFVDPLPSAEIDPHKGLPNDVESGRTRPLFPREFVAIDRFTGGAAEHLKFDCVAAWQPTLHGEIAIDIKNLQNRCDKINQLRASDHKRQHKSKPVVSSSPRSSKSGPSVTQPVLDPPPLSPAAALGLLFLTLRDLIEGDLALGMGAAKGFGQCHAQVACELVGGGVGELKTKLNVSESSPSAASTGVAGAMSGMSYSDWELGSLVVPCIDAVRDWLVPGRKDVKS